MEAAEFVLSNIRKDVEKSPAAVANTIELLKGGATIPFIARYRKEQTGGLDETVIRKIADRLEYYQQLRERKDSILKSIESQGKLTEDLKKQIVECIDRAALEDIYLPYKPKHKTRASIAKEKGLEPLANIMMTEKPGTKSKEELVSPFINAEKGVESFEKAVRGAQDIMAERISDDAGIRGWVRTITANKGILKSIVMPDFKDVQTKYNNYYDISEPLKTVPSHRILAIRRGNKEDILHWKIQVDAEYIVMRIGEMTLNKQELLFNEEILAAVQDSYDRLISTSIAVEVFMTALEKAGTEAIEVFSINLRNLLLGPPAGSKGIIGIDPGFRTGCKVAVVNEMGDFKEFRTIYPTEPKNDLAGSEVVLLELIKKYKPELIAIGNGTGSKETDQFVKGMLKKNKLKIHSMVVSEAGASVYSASELAGKEYPDLDLTARGAISIAHRLQDPLAELVKIDPKSIGVGQYQHDVNQKELKKSLGLTVESCVNFVGVDLNTASGELLKYVSGIGPQIAENIVKYRTENGKFKSRKELKEVPKLGPKAFEQCAGFLKVPDSKNPLDNSTIHPESYHVADRIAKDLGVKVKDLIGNNELIANIKPENYTQEAGAMTLQDILAELSKPGRDPRKEFKSVEFSSEINDIKDLTVGMVMTGNVTNVTNFGAFVDIGVHQDGLIHISQLSDKFVKTPYDIVSVGDTVTVEVLSVDVERKRIGIKKLNT